MPHGARRVNDERGSVPGDGARRGGAPRGGAPRGGAPRGGAPRGGAPGGRGRDGRGPRQSRRQNHGLWKRKSLLAKFGYIFATVVAVVGMVAAIGAYAQVHSLEGDVHHVNVSDLSGKTIYGALNILVVGSQMRAGQKGFFGVAPGDSPLTSNSDNLLLIHLDPTHTHATVLSIPRDLYAYEPACKDRSSFIGYGTYPAQTYPDGNLIDGALNIGGPDCAVAEVEDLTGIKLDHFIEFDFNSFRTMVDALGGVEVCVPKGGYHDPNSHLNLSAGLHKVTYDTALAYVRTRDDLGGADAGGDLPRIQLQQAFISSVVQQVEHSGLLTNIPSLLSLAKIAASALTVDQGLGSADSLLKLGESLAHLKSKNVNFLTLPTQTATWNSSHLMAVQPQDDVLYNMLRNGQRWHGSLPTVPDKNVKVQVLNGTGETGLAGRTATALRKLGFDVVSTGDTSYTSTTTVEYAGVQQADDAYTLGTALKNFPAGQNTLDSIWDQTSTPVNLYSILGSAGGTVTLTLGTDFNGVNPPAPATHTTTGKKSKHTKSTTATSPTVTSSAGAVQSRNAAANICSGLPPPSGN